MRLGWTTSKYSKTYRAVKTIRVNGKNKTQIVKSFGSEKQICEKYGVTDALHKAFGFCTSKQIVPVAKMRNIISQTKK